MIGSVKALCEVHLVLLILIVAVWVVEDVFSACSGRRGTSSLMKAHAHLSTSSAGCRNSSVEASTTVSMLVSRIHPDIRRVLSGPCRMAQPARITAFAANADHGLRLGDEVALRLSFVHMAQVVVLSDIGDSSHVLNLNHLIVRKTGATANPLIALHHKI